jgi:hypothetical protein
MGANSEVAMLGVPALDDKGFSVTIRGERWVIRQSKEDLTDADGKLVMVLIMEDEVLISYWTPERDIPALVASVVAYLAADSDGPIEEAQPVEAPVKKKKAKRSKRPESLPKSDRAWVKDWENFKAGWEE